MTINDILDRLQRVKKSGNSWIASCPCGQNHNHDDQKQSLSVSYDSSTGKILLYCHTGCSIGDICKSLGCKPSDLFVGESSSDTFFTWYAKKNNLQYVEKYSYCYGEYQDGLAKVRFIDSKGVKDFRWVKSDPSEKSGFKMSHQGCPHRLYVAGTIEDDTVVLVEGEKDANSVHNEFGVTAVSSENGATNGKPGNKWFPVYNDQLTGKVVYILWDNDQAGVNFAQIEARELAGKAKAIYLMDLATAWPECPKKGDITDLIQSAGSEKAKGIFSDLMKDAKLLDFESLDMGTDSNDTETDDNDSSKSVLPSWIFEIPTKGGGFIKKINEPIFCESFKADHHVVRVNGVFYYDGRAVTDDFILNEIQKQIQIYFVERVGRLTANVFVTLSNACYTAQPDPDERKVYCADYVTLTFSNAGEITRAKEDVFTLTRIPVPYNPEATCPAFENYLRDVFYEDDIPALQEFVGYCLVPSTRAQAALFIHGKGGEGKSVFRDVLMRLFGHTAKQESISNLDKAFVVANLENILVCIDDDMQTALMGETAMLKRLITMKGQQQVERKHQQKHDALIFARIIGIGNSFIGSKFDQSDGFYRRQLLIDCKPKTREKDDRFMSDKCVAEIQGVLVWALEGLSRLIRNGFNFSISERMRNTLDSIRRENDNVLAFIENNVEDTGNLNHYISSADLYDAYALDCKDNGDVPVKRKTFQTRISDRYRDRKDHRIIPAREKGKINLSKRKLTVYAGLQFKPLKDDNDWMVRLYNTGYSEDWYLERLT